MRRPWAVDHSGLLGALAGGDYSTLQAWPPIMTGALRTSIVLAASGNYYSCEVKCLPSKATVNITFTTGAGGGCTYVLTPFANEEGQDVFTYNVQERTPDGAAVESSQETNQVAIEIFGVNQPPVPTYKEVATVGRGTYFPPRHPTHSEPSFLELNGIL